MLAETTVRVRDYPARTSMQPHAHAEASMNIVVEGGFLERIGRQEQEYASGQIALLPAGVTHSQSFGTRRTRQIIIRPQDCWLDYLADCKTPLEQAPCGNRATFRHLGERLLEEIENEDRFSALAREAILLEIVTAFARNPSAAKAGAKPPAWLCAARDFVHEHALTPLSMVRIAQVAGRHEIHLAREFRRFFGTSVGAYMRRLRTEQVARQLRRPQTRISDIALDCGFSSHAHLCREFKAHFGITPSQYRSRHIA
jgi:AraC family transcriptional regulator